MNWVWVFPELWYFLKALLSSSNPYKEFIIQVANGDDKT